MLRPMYRTVAQRTLAKETTASAPLMGDTLLFKAIAGTLIQKWARFVWTWCCLKGSHINLRLELARFEQASKRGFSLTYGLAYLMKGVNLYFARMHARSWL
eukprot:TRINITY_DN11064_c0_g1_i11.p2 TRINITY_DN11064_c0_g1~~TRINITY_DN11064_c0_g1_i11.p2  ORF type:complete len:101 (+),score=3.69 TRINITY_DN11064_c0_g1_i11:80-382(+)